MRVYSVHAPPEEPISPEKFLFVKDGFSWPAFFFPVLWVLWHRMWLTLVYYVVFVLVVAWIGRLGGDNIATVFAVLGGVLFALEANNLRRLSLERRGWREVGGASGRNYDEAETRFFGDWAARPDAAPQREAMARAAYSPEARAHGGDEPILGLFPEPER
jgi:Protein of unknown function (DUF2628)